MVIAVDFDGTLFENEYPNVGKPIWKTINWIKDQQNKGNKIILWTCRCNQFLTDAVNACKEVGIEFDAVNNNLQEKLAFYLDDSRKVGADIYLDDKSIRPEDL